MNDHQETPDFALEPSVEPGRVPERVIAQLRYACAVAKDHAQAFGDAVDAQAKKYAVNKSALKRYVKALEGDTLPELDAEAEAILALANAHE